MNKLSVFVPLDGFRDDVVSYFANNGTTYLFDIGARISTETVVLDAADAAVYSAARLTAESLAAVDGLSVIDDDGVAYELMTEDAGVLGYEVVFYAAAE